MKNIPGMSHIVGGPSGPAFLMNSKKNNDDLIEKFKLLCGFDLDLSKSENEILEDFRKTLDAFQNHQEPANILAKTYLELLKKPSKEFNSAIYNFDKVLNASSDKFQQEFLNQLGIIIKKEVKAVVGKISFPKDSIKNVKARSPILDLSKQNLHVKKIVEQELKDLAKHQPDRNNKLFLEKLIDQEESVAKTGSSPLVARYFDFSPVRSDKSKSKTEREDFEYLKTIIKYLKLCKKGDVDVESPRDNAQLNEIELQLNEFMLNFRNTAKKTSGGRKEIDLPMPSISGASTPNRIAESRRAYSDLSFLSSQAFGEAENLMKQVRPTFRTSEDIAFGISRAQSSQGEESVFVASRSISQLDFETTLKKLSTEELKAFSDYIDKCSSVQSRDIEIDSRNLASVFEKIQKSKFTDQERSSFDRYLKIYNREKIEGPSSTTRVLSTTEGSDRGQSSDGRHSNTISL